MVVRLAAHQQRLPVEVLEQPVAARNCKRRQRAPAPPPARATHRRQGVAAHPARLAGPKLLGGATLALHEARLKAFELPDLFLFDTPQAALRASSP
jgi:hypothetical protein